MFPFIPIPLPPIIRVRLADSHDKFQYLVMTGDAFADWSMPSCFNALSWAALGESSVENDRALAQGGQFGDDAGADDSLSFYGSDLQ
jgi:hypothetical protein